jgi:Family of unknown function (DUF6174)
MLRAACLILASCVVIASASASPATDFENASQKWRAAGVRSYSFLYEWGGGVVIAPKCSGAKIRVTVRDGVSQTPVVVHGYDKCARGTRGKAIGIDVPPTVEALFAEIGDSLAKGQEKVAVSATYDPTWGIPLKYYAANKMLSDNDSGFVISDFKRLD